MVNKISPFLISSELNSFFDTKTTFPPNPDTIFISFLPIILPKNKNSGFIEEGLIIFVLIGIFSSFYKIYFGRFEQIKN